VNILTKIAIETKIAKYSEMMHSPLKAPSQGDKTNCKEKWIVSKAFKTGAPTKPIDYLYLKITCFTLSSFM